MNRKMIENGSITSKLHKSTISLVIMGLFLALAYLGAKLAEAFLGEDW
jgi:hypothetical protein